MPLMAKTTSAIREADLGDRQEGHQLRHHEGEEHEDEDADHREDDGGVEGGLADVGHDLFLPLR